MRLQLGVAGSFNMRGSTTSYSAVHAWHHRPIDKLRTIRPNRVLAFDRRLNQINSACPLCFSCNHATAQGI